MVHAAGFGAMLMIDDERVIAPSNYFNCDFTGIGFDMHIKEKHAVLLDVVKDAGAHKARQTSTATTLKVNMKLFSAMNGEGQGLDAMCSSMRMQPTPR